MLRLHYIVILLFLSLSVSSCKKQDEKLDLLIGGGGGGSSASDQLEIISSLPEQSSVTIEIGDTENFTITAVAPIPNVVSYSWTYDGSPVVAANNYAITGLLTDVGNHTLIATASDGDTSKQKTWNIKVNGPPTVTNVTTGTPAVSYNSNINLTASASDPNNDTLTYRWLLNGATSAFITGTTATGTLTGDISTIGANTVTVEVSDGTKTASYTWNVEVNYFPQACNQLTTGQICTYAGGAHKGNGLAANNTQFPLRFRPFTHVQDALGNFFISDLDNNVVWYWNNTGGSVNRVGQTIAAGVIQVVAGTGEDATGSAGIPATTSPLNNPRGLWYDDALDRLYIAEYDGHQIKYVDNTGTVFVGMGGGPSHIDGDTAFNHDCDRPVHLAASAGNLYVTCYNEHRVKRWDLTTDLGYTVAGDGGNDLAGENTVPTASGTGQPYGLFVDANGIYITLYNLDRVRFVNTTGAPITFWSGNPDQVIVAPGMIATIMGDGGNGGTPTAGNPLSSDIGEPASVFVRNGNEIFVAGRRSDDIVLGNNSGGPITLDSLVVAAGQLGRINSGAGGWNGSSFGFNSTRINDVYSLSIDRTDNDRLILADYSNYRMRDVNLTNGDVSDFLGSGRGKNGFYGDGELPVYQHLLDYPTGLGFDNTTGSLFIADQNNYVVRQVDRYGRMKTAIGNGDATGDPTIDNDTPNNARIRSNINGNNSMNNGFDIWTDGTMAQLNSYGHNVRLWNRSGSDRVYLNQFIQNDRISTVAGDWTSPGASDGPALTAQMRYPNSVKFYNNAGNMELFIADTMNHCIRHVDAVGNMTTVLGLCGTAGDPGNNVPEASARFNRPRGIAVTSNGNLFISDYNNHHIWYWNRSGTAVTIGSITINPNMIAVVSCLTGTSGSPTENVLTSSSRCNQPAGLAINGNDLCYAQRNRHNVRCFNMTTGFVRTVAGRLEASPRSGSTVDFSQEGVNATSQATLSYPSNITFDANGDLYISDTYNHVIRKVKLSP